MKFLISFLLLIPTLSFARANARDVSVSCQSERCEVSLNQGFKQEASKVSIVPFAPVNIETILEKNLGKVVGTLDLQPQFDCDLEVKPFSGQDTKYIVYSGFAASVEFMDYPSIEWSIDEKNNTLKFDFEKNSKNVMNLEFDPQTLKFTKFFRTVDGKKTSACILK